MDIELDEVVPRRRPRQVWWLAVLGIVGVVAGAAGFAWSRRSDDPGYLGVARPAGPQPDLRWTLDQMPAGWTAFGAAEMVPPGFTFSWTTMGSFRMTAYGTTDDPLAPTIVLGVGGDLNEGGAMAAASKQVSRIDANGVVGSCGTEEFGWQRCLVAKGDRSVQTHSRGMTDDELRAVLSTLHVVDGAPAVDVGSLPVGMSSLGSWRNEVPSAISAVHDGAVVAFIAFGGTDGKVGLQVGHAADQQLAFAFETRALHATEVDGVTYYEGEIVDSLLRTLNWEHDGFAFELNVFGVTDFDLIDIARGLRPASAAEWAAAVTATPIAMERQDQSTTSSGPTTTEPPIVELAADDIVDTQVTATASLLPEGGGLVVHAPVPGMADVPFTLLPLPQGYSTALGDGDYTLSGYDGDGAYRLWGIGNDRFDGAYVYTTDMVSTTLRVIRTSGERYNVDLVDVPGDPGRRVAYIAVPLGELWGADVIDTFGKVLDRFGLSLD